MSRSIRLAAPVAIITFAVFALATLAVPPAVNAAGPSCPDLFSAHGLSPRSVQVGEQLTVTGTYTDWASPGTVSATFHGPAGVPRVEHAANLPDGTYTIDVTFGPSDVGSWTVDMQVDEVAGTTACEAAFDVVAGALPNTAAELASNGSAPSSGAPVGAVVTLAAAALLAASIALWFRSARADRAQ